MFSALKLPFLVLLAFISVSSASAQNKRGFYGNEFWVTFTENLYRPDSLYLLVAPETTDTITVFNPQLNLSLPPFIVKPGRQNQIAVPFNLCYSVLAFGPQGTGIQVKSKRLVQLFALNPLPETVDLTAVLPVELLKNSQEYLVHGYSGQNSKEAQVAILALDTGITDVRAKITADLFTGSGKGSTVNYKLRQGQVILLQALDTQDLSGTIVTVTNGCKRIAVYYGVKCGKVLNRNVCQTFDHQFEQVWPSVFLGKEFLLPPVPSNTQYQMSIAALQDNTEVTLASGNKVNLNRGQVFKIPVFFSVPYPLFSDKPVSCVQILNSYGCNGSAGLSGDPSLLNIAPIDQQALSNKAAYQLYRKTGYNHFLTLIVKSTTVPSVFQNGSLLIVPGGFKAVTISGKTYHWANVNTFHNNSYKLQCDSGFVAYLHGLAPNESYATCFSASLYNRNSDFIADPEPVCKLGQFVTFTALGDSLNNVRWFLGDGNSGSGNKILHAYSQYGVYQVKMLNSNPGSSCPIDTVVKNVRVLKGPDNFLPRDTQPCKGTIFRVQLNFYNGVKYGWENGTSGLIQNIDKNRQAILTTRDSNGCVILDTVDVKFKDCSNLILKLANVFTPGEDGKNDNWRVIYEGWDQIDVRIYNRWGELIAKYTLPDEEDWNGKVMNKFTDLPEGTYFYSLDCYDRETLKRENFAGSINLIR